MSEYNSLLHILCSDSLVAGVGRVECSQSQGDDTGQKLGDHSRGRTFFLLNCAKYIGKCRYSENSSSVATKGNTDDKSDKDDLQTEMNEVEVIRN